MNPLRTLTLQMQNALFLAKEFQMLVSLSVSALVLLTGCITTTKTTRIESSISGQISEIAQPSGYQQISDPIKNDDNESGIASIVGDSSSYPNWFELTPDLISSLPLHQQLETGTTHSGEVNEPLGLVTIEGFLSNNLPDDPAGFNSVFDDDMQLENLTLWKRIKSDHTNYYSKDSLTWLAGGLGVGAIMANTSIDEGIQNHFQTSVHSASSDDWIETLHAQKEWGNGRYTLPIFAAAWVAGKLFERVPLASTTGEWGERSIRAILVGTPPMLAMQYVTGASRPGETSSGSRWKPFQDNNGVSGHSFMGAILFLAAAKMTKKPLLKLAFYAGSTLAPLSRVNDNHHYPSQAFLGWWMAWIATNAVDATQKADRNWSVFPISYPGASGIAVEFRW
ncbi:phosphatase PAP2 family protein [Gimesia algae]|uniref:PAP2 superfamily protein n=1 Tax=Gimesia algae TaxID=2527971 RepID=A0A517VES6_9PLAN|nr:phosphatase PAP2 family protein [Gimesia algae]QDT91496.1 PAP2 superfamily protein [Gimesia algae]